MHSTYAYALNAVLSMCLVCVAKLASKLQCMREEMHPSLPCSFETLIEWIFLETVVVKRHHRRHRMNIEPRYNDVWTRAHYLDQTLERWRRARREREILFYLFIYIRINIYFCIIFIIYR